MSVTSSPARTSALTQVGARVPAVTSCATTASSLYDGSFGGVPSSPRATSPAPPGAGLAVDDVLCPRDDASVWRLHLRNVEISGENRRRASRFQPHRLRLPLTSQPSSRRCWILEGYALYGG